MLQPQRTQARMIIRTTPKRPMILAIRFLDGQIVDARDAHPHQPLLVELPVLVAIGAEVLTTVVAPFVRKTHRDAIAVKGPQLLDEPIVELPGPFASQEGNDLLA